MQSETSSSLRRYNTNKYDALPIKKDMASSIVYFSSKADIKNIEINIIELAIKYFKNLNENNLTPLIKRRL